MKPRQPFGPKQAREGAKSVPQGKDKKAYQNSFSHGKRFLFLNSKYIADIPE